MTAATATYRAMLQLAGYTSDDQLWAKPAEGENPEQQRIRMRLARSFADLESAERAFSAALASMDDQTARERKHLADGDRADAGWIMQAATKAAEADAKMKTATELIQMLTWLAKPKADGS